MARMKRSCLFTCTTIFAASIVHANNGDQMIGFSGLSNAVGGAVTATPQDVTTSLSNPAGLAVLDLGKTNTRFDMNLAILNPIRELNGVESNNSVYLLATGGFAFRNKMMGDRITVALGAYPVSGGGVDFPSQAFLAPDPITGIPSPVSIVATRQSLRIGPSVAYKVTDKFSLGLNVSLVSNMMSLKGVSNFPADVAYGYSYVLGTTYDLSDSVRLGAAYTSRTHTEKLEWNLNDGKHSLTFDDPQTVAVGISFYPTDRFMVEMDLKWLDFSGVRDNAVLQTPSSLPDQTLTYGWSDQYVLALGIKYVHSDNLTFLAGYNYGKSPLDEDDINNNIGVTAIVEHHLSGGVTMRVTEHTELTFSIIHGFSNSMTASVGPPTEVVFETNLATIQFSYKN